jgi:fimbrial chaperone protein
MQSFSCGVLIFVAGVFGAQVAQAGSLSIAPIKVEVLGPRSSSSVTLKNESNQAANVQIRLFRWTLSDGLEKLEPTQEVVASPPIATLKAGGSQRVRVVRTGKAPVLGEESYRLVIDELPDRNRIRNGAIAVLLRYNVPVFFTSPDATQAQLRWGIIKKYGKTFLSANNGGDKRVRIADLSLGSVLIRKGLAGYVLGRSQALWSVKEGIAGTVAASTDQGAISVPLVK